jgi:hypothetical protein
MPDTDRAISTVIQHFTLLSRCVHAKDTQCDVAPVKRLIEQSRWGDVKQFLHLWRQLLNGSDLTAGCAVLAVTVAGSDLDVLDHASAIFRD